MLITIFMDSFFFFFYLTKTEKYSDKNTRQDSRTPKDKNKNTKQNPDFNIYINNFVQVFLQFLFLFSPLSFLTKGRGAKHQGSDVIQ